MVDSNTANSLTKMLQANKSISYLDLNVSSQATDIRELSLSGISITYDAAALIGQTQILIILEYRSKSMYVRSSVVLLC